MTTSVSVLDSSGATQTINTLPALGQAPAAASLPVTLASDQGALAVTVSGSPIQATGGTVGLVAGVAAIGTVGVTGTITVSGSPMQATGGTVGILASGSSVTSTLIGGKQRLDVTLAAGVVPGAAAPAFQDTVGGTDGVNARTFLTDTSGRLIANINSGAVTANAGTNLNTSALALDATLTGGTQQTKITDGTRVATIKAASTAAVATDTAIVVALSPNNAIATTTTALASTSSPSYANATNNSLSANLAGALRVDGSGVTQPVSGAVTANLGTGIPDISSTGNTLNSATLNLAYTLTMGNGQSTVSFSVAGLTASAATLAIEASDDGGTTWSAVNGIAPGTGILFTTMTTDQQFRVGAAGRNRIRLRVSIVGVGTITIASTISVGVGLMALSAPLPVGSNIIGALVANQSVNKAQINGVVPLMGNGVTGTGSQRVTIASDNTPFSINAVQSGTWNVGTITTLPALATGANVIGAVTQSGTWNIGTVTTLPALPANQSVNVAQMAGVATSMGAGVADTGTQRVVLSNEAAADLNITGQAVQTAAGQNIILAVAGVGATDCTGYRAVSIQINPAGTVSAGVISFEGSNDNVTFTAISLQDEAAPTADPVSTVSPLTGVNRYMTGPVRWRYFRARISTLIGGGGSIGAVTRLTQVSFSDDQISVTQTTASLLNVTVGAAIPTGSNNIGSITAVGRTNNGAIAGRISSGASGFFKASSGQLYCWSLINTQASIRYLQIYAKASAGIPGTDTPIFTIPLLASGRSDFEVSIGIASINGIAWAITTDAAGVTSGATGDILGSVGYV